LVVFAKSIVVLPISCPVFNTPLPGLSTEIFNIFSCSAKAVAKARRKRASGSKSGFQIKPAGEKATRRASR
jgi:hypothetical protein